MELAPNPHIVWR